MPLLLKHKFLSFSMALTTLLGGASLVSAWLPTVYAQTSGTTPPGHSYQCGSNPASQSDVVYTSIDFGCKGDICNADKPATYKPDDPYCQSYHNPIIDLSFAIVRLLSDGVGIVVVGSIIVGGLMFMTSQDDPQATSKAIGRIRTSLIALLVYIFAYAILNYVIPQGFFHV